MAEIESKDAVEERQTQTAPHQRTAGEEILRRRRLTSVQKGDRAESALQRRHIQPRRPERGSPALAIVEPPHRREPAQPKERLRHGWPGGDPCLEPERDPPAPAQTAARLAVESAGGAPLATDDVRGESPAERIGPDQSDQPTSEGPLVHLRIQREETGAPQEVVHCGLRGPSNARLLLQPRPDVEIEPHRERSLERHRTPLRQGIIPVVVPGEERVERVAEPV